MGRIIKEKELKNTRLASTYGGWIYCDACNQNIGYLCYVTYDTFHLEYDCACGSHGSLFLAFEDKKEEKSKDKLILVKNRFCCPTDASPLFTILEKKLKKYKVEVICTSCKKEYCKESQ